MNKILETLQYFASLIYALGKGLVPAIVCFLLFKLDGFTSFEFYTTIIMLFCGVYTEWRVIK
jgi:hypothetical protein